MEEYEKLGASARKVYGSQFRQPSCEAKKFIADVLSICAAWLKEDGAHGNIETKLQARGKALILAVNKARADNQGGADQVRGVLLSRNSRFGQRSQGDLVMMRVYTSQAPHNGPVF